MQTIKSDLCDIAGSYFHTCTYYTLYTCCWLSLQSGCQLYYILSYQLSHKALWQLKRLDDELCYKKEPHAVTVVITMEHMLIIELISVPESLKIGHISMTAYATVIVFFWCRGK